IWDDEFSGTHQMQARQRPRPKWLWRGGGCGDGRGLGAIPAPEFFYPLPVLTAATPPPAAGPNAAGPILPTDGKSKTCEGILRVRNARHRRRIERMIGKVSGGGSGNFVGLDRLCGLG